MYVCIISFPGLFSAERRAPALLSAEKSPGNEVVISSATAEIGVQQQLFKFSTEHLEGGTDIF